MTRRSVGGSLRRRARRVVDRVVAPYLEELQDASRHAPPPEAPPAVEQPAAVERPAATAPPSDRFHRLNHELRTIALEAAPKGAATVLSVGASGRWYFDWFEACVGPADLHIGVEAHEPRPDDLPPGVRWEATTADRLEGIEASSVGLVFAGQTTEHLWARELHGFLLGAHRVLADEGWLVLDSPNRLVTEQLLWSHGGHTVELSPAEIGELLDLAGFDVAVLKGLWRCRFDDRVLPLEEGLDDPALLLRRALPSEPDDAFIWWVEARRSPVRPPDRERLRARIDDLYESHWPTRVSRGLWPGPPATAVELAAEGSSTLASLPFPLHEGRWRLDLALEAGRLDDLEGLEARLVAPGGMVVAALDVDTAARSDSGVSWQFDVPYFLQALVLEIRIARHRRPARLAMPIGLRTVSSSPASAATD